MPFRPAETASEPDSVGVLIGKKKGGAVITVYYDPRFA